MDAQHFETVQKASGKSPLNKFLTGPIMGVILVLAAAGLMYWNETRTADTELAARAIPLAGDEVTNDASLQGQLVAVTGLLTTTDTLGDGQYLKPGPYLAFERHVEMFAWMEDKKTEAAGEGQEKVSYDYRKAWVENPLDPNSFTIPVGHENPVKALPSLPVQKTGQAKVGAYSLDISSLTFPGLEVLQPTTQNTNLLPGVTLDSGQFGSDTYIYVIRGFPSDPQVGDLRIRYSVLPAGKRATVFGALSGQGLSTYSDPSEKKLYRLVFGTREEALAALQTEATIQTWVSRGIGFLLFWAGFIGLAKAIQGLAAMGASKLRVGGAIIAAIFTVLLVVLF